MRYAINVDDSYGFVRRLNSPRADTRTCKSLWQQKSCGNRKIKSMGFLLGRDGVCALRIATAKGQIVAGILVERDYQVVRRRAGCRGDPGC